MATLTVSFDRFEQENEDCCLDRIKLACIMHGVSEMKNVAKLLMSMGSEVYSIIKAAIYPDKIADTNYEWVCEILGCTLGGTSLYITYGYKST